MRFQYSLQKIVDLKENEKLQAEWLLADAMQKLLQEEHSLQELYELEETLQTHLQELTLSKASVFELQMVQQYIQHVNQLIEQKKLDVKSAKGNVENKQQGLTNKAKEAKIWDRARGKARDQFMVEFRRKEQQEIDEIAVVRASS